ncbi:MAG: hypothetical protein AB1714_02545 [Acidobacteriota bacterium]
MTRRTRWLNWPTLAVFVFVLACVNLSHTEEYISSNDNDQCPAGVYGQSLATAQHADIIPACRLAVVEQLEPVEVSWHCQAVLFAPLSRSPPTF